MKFIFLVLWTSLKVCTNEKSMMVIDFNSDVCKENHYQIFLSSMEANDFYKSLRPDDQPVLLYTYTIEESTITPSPNSAPYCKVHGHVFIHKACFAAVYPPCPGHDTCIYCGKEKRQKVVDMTDEEER